MIEKGSLLRETFLIFFAVATFAVALILLLDALGVVTLSLKDRVETPTEKPVDPGPDPTTPPTTTAPPQEEPSNTWETVRKVSIIVLSIGLIATAGYILFYKLRGYHGYVRWLAKAAWMYPIPATLVIVGIIIRATTNIPIITSTASDVCFGLAGTVLFGEFILYYLRRARAFLERKADEGRLALVQYINAIKDGVDESIEAARQNLAEKVQALSDALTAIGQLPGQAKEAAEQIVFSNPEDDLRAALADLPSDLRVKIMRYKRVNGLATDPFSTDPAKMRKQQKAAEKYLRNLVRKQAKTRNEAEELWSDVVMGLTAWRSRVEKYYPTKIDKVLHEIETDLDGKPLYERRSSSQVSIVDEK